MRSSSGSRRLLARRYSDGISLRAVRSPDAPKMTRVSGATSMRWPPQDVSFLCVLGRPSVSCRYVATYFPPLDSDCPVGGGRRGSRRRRLSATAGAGSADAVAGRSTASARSSGCTRPPMPRRGSVSWRRCGGPPSACSADHPGLQGDDSAAFPQQTTAVPEVSLSWSGPGPRFVFRWYKLTSDWKTRDWIEALLKRQPPPVGHHRRQFQRQRPRVGDLSSAPRRGAARSRIARCCC